MNRVMFIGSLVGIVIFIVFLVLTFVAQTWLKDFARDYINRRIEPTLTRQVMAIELKILPMLERNPTAQERISQEIEQYQLDPLAFIDKYTSGRLPERVEDNRPRWADTWRPLPPETTSLPQTVGNHFRQVFDHLVLDLRIFAITNLLAFTVVAMLMRGYDARSPRLLIQAFIPFLATCYGTTVYIKQDWFFNLLLDFHMGYLYPFFVIVTMLDLWIRWRGGQLRKRAGALKGEMLSG